MSNSMQYSLDGGKTWTFAGGTNVLINLDRVTATEILVKDLGSAATAPSDIQSIPLTREKPSTPSSKDPAIPNLEGSGVVTDNSAEQNSKTVSRAGLIAAIVVGSAVAVGVVGWISYTLFKRKKRF